MKYSTLLFDADDTLLDFQQAESKALDLVFSHYGIVLSEDMKSRYLEINIELWSQFEKGLVDKHQIRSTRFARLFGEYGIDLDGVLFNDCYQEFLGAGYDTIDGAARVCARISESHELYIVTNGTMKTQFSRIEGSGLKPFFRDVFVSEQIGFQKPRKEYFDYVFDKISEKDLSKVLIIGDSLTSDMTGGSQAGIDTCWFNPNGLKAVSKVKPTYEIRSLEELYTIV